MEREESLVTLVARVVVRDLKPMQRPLELETSVVTHLLKVIAEVLLAQIRTLAPINQAAAAVVLQQQVAQARQAPQEQVAPGYLQQSSMAQLDITAAAAVVVCAQGQPLDQAALVAAEPVDQSTQFRARLARPVLAAAVVETQSRLEIVVDQEL